MSRRVPVVRQLEISDCGAACLAMTLAYHGRPATLDELRLATRTGRDGVDAAGLVDAAGRYGLHARGVRRDLDDFDQLPRGSILHWELSQFVVLERGLIADTIDDEIPFLGGEFFGDAEADAA